MGKVLIAAALLLLAAAGGGYYYFLYPPEVRKHATEQALKELDRAVATKDRSKVQAAFGTLLSDRAEIQLNIHFYSIMKQTGTGNDVGQHFNKQEFITFIDNILYSLSDYGREAELQTFHMNGAGADVTFISKEWGDGQSFYGGSAINMRFHTETSCTGQVEFSGKKALLSKAICDIILYSLPKPGQEDKLRNPEMLKEYLR